MGLYFLAAAEKEEIPCDLDLEAGAVIRVVGFRQRLGIEIDRAIDLTGTVGLQSRLFTWCGALGPTQGREKNKQHQSTRDGSKDGSVHATTLPSLCGLGNMNPAKIP
jgi:hypothetical protein